MGRTKRWLSKPTQALVATIALFVITPYALAQNVAGKLATRTKLVDESKTKKKRSFWGGKTAQQEVANVDDGEYTFWSRRRRQREKKGTNEGDELSWRWELFYAETKMIMVSVVTSVLCAVLSWMWYARPTLCGDNVKKKSGEEGGE